MRAFVFLLILANLSFFAWAQGYFGVSLNPDAGRERQQLRAEQIRIVARDEPPAAESAAPAPVAAPAVAPAAESAAAPVEKKVTEVCLYLGELSEADADALEKQVADKHSAFQVARTTANVARSYWVLIPPLANRQDVDKKVAELKKLKVPEYFVVQDAGPYQRAISLGLFSSKEAATARYEALTALGVRSAKIAEKTGKPESVALEFRGPDSQADGLRQSLADAVSGRSPTECPVAEHAAQ